MTSRAEAVCVLGEEAPVLLPPMRGSTGTGQPGDWALLSGTALGASNKSKHKSSEKVTSRGMAAHAS